MNGKISCLQGPFSRGKMKSAGRKPRSFGVLNLLSELPARLAKRATAKSAGVKSSSSIKKAATKKAKKKTTAKRATAAKGKTKKAATKKTTARKKVTKKTTAAKKPKKKTMGKRKKSTTTATRKKKTTTKKIKTTSKKSDLEKRRRPRLYSIRSRLSTFMIGDIVIFKQVRDWNNTNQLIELRGAVIGMGSDPVSGVNYIEVMFEIKSLTGNMNRQVRRFTVK